MVRARSNNAFPITVENVPLKSEALAPRIDRKYILCKSDLPYEGMPYESSSSKSVNVARLERKAIESAVDVFGKCAVINLNLEMNNGKFRPWAPFHW